MTSQPGRDDRFYGPEDDRQRTPGERDRDRILYTSALRRLAGVTQVVSAAEGHVYHNRLTHTLEVAQIGRRLAQKFQKLYPPDLLDALGGLDPEVVEAACLAHDLGHPPFGHIAETEIDSLLTRSSQLPDGFEGNPQSFRVVTKLATRSPAYPGLNLTRATLNAVLKYPWPRAAQGFRQAKWGAYSSELPEFEFARSMNPSSEFKSLEAELMDWADDIAYSVHDVEDFYRAGFLPLHLLVKGTEELDRFLQKALARYNDREEKPYKPSDLEQSFREMIREFPMTEPYHGTTVQRGNLRALTSRLVDRFINAIRANESGSSGGRSVVVVSDAGMQVLMLKELTWCYVIESSALATQQHGQRQIIKTLLDVFCEASDRERDWAIFPRGYEEQLRELGSTQDAQSRRLRLAVDLVANMTEQQAIELYQRITGQSIGSIHQMIVR